MIALYGIVVRELQRLVHRPIRIVTGIARPLIWLFVVGSGVGALASGADPGAYQRFMLPGVVGMVILFSAMLAALSTAHDREFGAVRLLLLAPVHRGVIVLGKIAGSTVVAVAQAALLLLLVPLLEIDATPERLLLLFFGMVLTASALSAVGMVVASTVESLETFSGLMNFVTFPMLFLSGALYPARALPAELETLARLNPLTYGVDLMKHALLGPHARFGPELPILHDVAALLAAFLIALALSVALFDRETRLKRLVDIAGRRL